jgi:hypothetical protein
VWLQNEEGFVTKEQIDQLIKDSAEVDRPAEGAADEGPAAEGPNGNIGPVNVDLKNLPGAIDEAIAAGLTPLILDDSDQHVVDTFFSYSAVIVDVKQLSLNVAMKKMTAEAALEKARSGLVLALQSGRTLVVACQQGAPSFNKWFNTENEWPLGTILTRAGKGYTAEKSTLADAVMRDVDKVNSSGFAVVDPKFATVVTSWFKAEDYEEFLFNGGKGPLGSVGRKAFRVIIAVGE